MLTHERMTNWCFSKQFGCWITLFWPIFGLLSMFWKQQRFPHMLWRAVAPFYLELWKKVQRSWPCCSGKLWCKKIFLVECVQFSLCLSPSLLFPECSQYESKDCSLRGVAVTRSNSSECAQLHLGLSFCLAGGCQDTWELTAGNSALLKGWRVDLFYTFNITAISYLIHK